MPTLPADLTDRVKAVNVLLSSIAEAPIASLDGNESVEADGATRLLDEINIATQTKGWCWNREEALPLVPQSDGTISLPANCLYVGQAYWDSHAMHPAKLVERGRKLYNRTDHTYAFADPIYCDLILLLAWEDMPEYARRYITLAAAQQFQARYQGNALVDRVTEKEVVAAYSILLARDDEAERLNVVTGNKGVVDRLSRSVRRR